jgi:hypothetical protein
MCELVVRDREDQHLLELLALYGRVDPARVEQAPRGMLQPTISRGEGGCGGEEGEIWAFARGSSAGRPASQQCRLARRPAAMHRQRGSFITAPGRGAEAIAVCVGVGEDPRNGLGMALAHPHGW